MSFRKSNANDDFIYSNLIIGNTAENTTIMASGEVNSQIPIVKNPSNYIGCICRWEIDNWNMPLLVPYIRTGQNNINLTVYQFAMRYNQFTTPNIDVIFVPNNLARLPKSPIGGQDLSTNYYYTYNYVEMLSMFNTALASAVTSISTLASLNNIDVPIFTFNPTTGIILTANSTQFRQSYGVTGDSNFIQILCNNYVAPLLNGFSLMQQTTSNSCKFSILLDPITQPPVNNLYTITNQSLNELCYWKSVKTIQFGTNMPISYEFTGAPLNTKQQQQQTQVLLTDFTPDSGDLTNYHNTLIYTQTNTLRMYNFTSQTPLYSYNTTIYFSDNYGRQYPMMLSQGQTVNIKYQFIKRSAYKP